MTIPINSRQRAKDLVEQLPGESLTKAIALLEALCQEATHEASAVADETQETALLQTIQRRLSAEEQSRLDYLRQRNEAEAITTAEHQELLAYVERVEQQDAERAAALIQLARLRHVDLNTVVSQFLPSPRLSDAC
jgi:hypothetical protein